MILEKQKEVVVLNYGQQSETLKMELDLDSAQVLMQMLSKNLYSDAIGSTIRETASNALDSHRKAGVTDPIIVSLNKNTEDNYEFSVEDFGIGLDHNDVVNIIRKYGKSTKRDDKDALGMMGLGFKAPLAYTSSFYFVCRKNEIESKYMMYEGEQENEIEPLYKCNTEERDGVKIIIPVKYKDKEEFFNKIKKQLAYFENVYFNVSTNYNSLKNDFTIYRGKNYQFSEILSDPSLHICLDNVYYSIDFDKLGIDPLYIPIGLRFSLSDGLFPTPNRETLRYTQEAKQIILKKIESVANEFMDMYNSTIEDTDDILAILSHYKLQKRHITVSEKQLDVTELLKYASVKLKTPSLKGISLLNIEELSKNADYILYEYDFTFNLNYGRMSAVNGGYWNTNVSFSIYASGELYVYDDVFSANKKAYLKETIGKHKVIRFIKKTKDFDMRPAKIDDLHNNYYALLGLKNYPDLQHNDVIAEFRIVINLILEKFKNVDDLIIPQSWLDARKKQKIYVGKGTRTEKEKTDITCKEATNLERSVEGQNCKFVPKVYNGEIFNKNEFLTIYDIHESKNLLDNIYNEGKSQKLNYITISEREKDKIEKLNLHNLISYDEFMKGENKPFKRLATGMLIDKFITENKDIFSNKELFKTLKRNVYKKLKKLEEYRNKNYSKSYDTYDGCILKLALDNGIWDTEIYDVYIDVYNLIEKYYFISPLCKKTYLVEKTTSVEILRDMFKRYKYRLDYTNYTLKNNELIKNDKQDEQ